MGRRRFPRGVEGKGTDLKFMRLILVLCGSGVFNILLSSLRLDLKQIWDRFGTDLGGIWGWEGPSMYYYYYESSY